MKIIKILGIAAGLHALALILIFANPGCSYTKAASPDPTPIIAAPVPGAPDPSQSPFTSASEPVMIRYSPTRPGTTVASALTTQPVSGVTPATTYTVVRGDSIWTIAKKNQLTKAEILSANNLGAGAVLRIGQKLIIPAKSSQGETASMAPSAPEAPAGAATPAAPAEKPAGDSVKHIVKSGETLGAIARKYGVRQGDIAVANNITDPRKIRPGQELVIPAKSTPGGKAAKNAKPRAETVVSTPAEPMGTDSMKTTPPAGGDQDLDAGLKPPAGEDVPVVKIEDASQAAQPKNP